MKTKNTNFDLSKISAEELIAQLNASQNAALKAALTGAVKAEDAAKAREDATELRNRRFKACLVALFKDSDFRVLDYTVLSDYVAVDASLYTPNVVAHALLMDAEARCEALALSEETAQLQKFLDVDLNGRDWSPASQEMMSKKALKGQVKVSPLSPHINVDHGGAPDHLAFTASRLLVNLFGCALSAIPVELGSIEDVTKVSTLGGVQVWRDAAQVLGTLARTRFSDEASELLPILLGDALAQSDRGEIQLETVDFVDPIANSLHRHKAATLYGVSDAVDMQGVSRDDA